MKSEFLISGIETGQLNAMVKKVMAQIGVNDPKEAVRMMNAGELQVSVIKPKWREENGIIYFSVTSDGATGEEWITRLESKYFGVSDYAKSILRSKDFKSTRGITTEIAVIPGLLFEDNDRTTKNIRAYAKKRQLLDPNAEVACLIREKFSDKEIKVMGLWWIAVMHKPIKDSGGVLKLLGVGRSVIGYWLSTDHDYSDHRWDRDYGLAFLSSQVGP